jgi:glutathione S-transferase
MSATTTATTTETSTVGDCTTTVTTTVTTVKSANGTARAFGGVAPPTKDTMTVGYWKIRGLAQAIRVLCEYCGFEFENQMFEQTPAPRPIPEKMCVGHPFPSMEAYEESKKCWFDVKQTVMGGYHSPNLPFLIDGDVKLSESNAILRYLGSKAAATGKFSTIMGSTPAEVAANEFTIEKAMELRNNLIAVGYGTFVPSFKGTIAEIMGGEGRLACDYYDEIAAEYKSKIPDDNRNFEAYISHGGGPYFAGSHLTVCDFHMYELLDQQRSMFGPEIYRGFPKIEAFMEAFGSIPVVVAAYKKYDLPANNEMAWTTVANIV